MKAEIQVEALGNEAYEVVVVEGDSRSTHRVELKAAELERFAAGASAPGLLRASFAFLLEREPKESILARFELSVIERYFPEYPERIGAYLERAGS